MNIYDFRSQLDTDDEVRDRATFYLNVLQQKQKAINSAYILNGERCHAYSVSFPMVIDKKNIC